MLVGLAGGLYLANISQVEGAPVARALRQHALPIYVVWFALAGAGLTVDALADLWPWVVLLVGLRAVALRYGVQWAGRSPEVTPALAREGWLGLISQAGVALGLAPMVRRALPASGVSLEALIVALIAALLGFGGIAAGAVGIAKVLFFVFLVILIVSVLTGRRGAGPGTGL